MVAALVTFSEKEEYAASGSSGKLVGFKESTKEENSGQSDLLKLNLWVQWTPGMRLDVET